MQRRPCFTPKRWLLRCAEPLARLYPEIIRTTLSTSCIKVGGCLAVSSHQSTQILFIVPPDKANEVKEFARVGILDLKLSINVEKTETSIFKKNPGSAALECDRTLQYLGFLFDGKKVLIRSAAFAKFSSRMKRGVSLANATASSRNKLRENFSTPIKDVYMKKLLARHSHLGRRNFLRYGYRAADILDSPAIKRQLRPLWARLRKEIECD